MELKRCNSLRGDFMELKKCSSCKDTTSSARELHQKGRCKVCSNYKRVFCQINFVALHKKRLKFYRYSFDDANINPQNTKTDIDKEKE